MLASPWILIEKSFWRKEHFKIYLELRICTHLSLFAALVSKTSSKKWKCANDWPPTQKQWFSSFNAFLFRNTLIVDASLFLQMLEHLAAGLEDLFELSNIFDAPIPCRDRLIHFYLWDDQRVWVTPKYEPAKNGT
jgi:hypothetical protein